MKKRPINKILSAVVERKPEVQVSHQYRYIQEVLNKENDSITYEEKLRVRENLRVLCDVCGLCYERMVLKACQE